MKINMTFEEQTELFLLQVVLYDTLICNRLERETLEIMLKRYSELIDKFINNYKSLESSAKDSLMNYTQVKWSGLK